MDVFKAYTRTTTAHLLLQSLPLLFTPKLILTLLLASESETRRITDLETYLCRALGLGLLGFAALVALFTGVLPLEATTTAVGGTDTDGDGGEGERERKYPYAYPTLVVTVIYHTLTSLHLYTQQTQSTSFALTSGLILSTSLLILGLWILLFGGDKGSFSKKTGADKRTGGWPFGNKETSRFQRKEREREAKEAKEKEKRRGKGRA